MSATNRAYFATAVTTIATMPASLRVAVTDRCNLRCTYCMPEGAARAVRAGNTLEESPSRLQAADEAQSAAPGTVEPQQRRTSSSGAASRTSIRSLTRLSLHGGSPAGRLDLGRLAELVRWLHERFRFGKVKITGGEPLVHGGVVDFVRTLSALAPPPELSMTSNGTLLAPHAQELREAGLERVNVSLDSIDPARFEALTGGRLEAVLNGIAAAQEAGLGPVKVNAVLRRSSWREDVPGLLDLAVERGLKLRFIELMRTGTERAWCERERILASEVLCWLHRQPECQLEHGGDLTVHGAEPARRGRLRWRGHALEVGWILPVSRPFCSSCNRLRLDSAGRLRRCLMDGSTLDLTRLTERPEANHELAAFMAGKRPPGSMDHPQPMLALGG